MTHKYRGFSIDRTLKYGYHYYKVHGERCRLTDYYKMYTRLKDAKKDIDKYLDEEKTNEAN